MIPVPTTGEWMVAANRDTSIPDSSHEMTEERDRGDKGEEEGEKLEVVEMKGDPEMAPVYLRQLLPVFTQVYQSTMLPSVRLVCLLCRVRSLLREDVKLAEKGYFRKKLEDNGKIENEIHGGQRYYKIM